MPPHSLELLESRPLKGTSDRHAVILQNTSSDADRGGAIKVAVSSGLSGCGRARVP